MAKSWSQFILIGVLSRNVIASSTCQNATITSCEQCMAVDPDCIWCSDPLDESELKKVNKVRCRSRNSPGNCLTFIQPKSDTIYVDPMEQSLMPRRFNITLRRNFPYNISLEFTRPEYANIDLFYLLDLSNSMKKYMEDVKKFFPTLIDRMSIFAVDPNSNDSRNKDQFRIGFGSFVDRPVAPFYYDHPEHIKNPCLTNGNQCEPMFTFDVTSRLTSNVLKTKEDLKAMKTSDNIDPSEAVLDAILQSIRCERDDGVGWHGGAFKLLVVTTDASYKAAGDGLIGGLFNANDGQCHKGGDWPFYEKNIDYPSIGQIYEAVEGSGVGIFFLTIPSEEDNVNPLKSYKELAKILPNAEAGQLSKQGENSEAIDLIVGAYEKMAEKVLLRGSANHPDHLQVVVYKKCGEDEDYVKCEDINKCLCEKVAKKEKVSFMVEYLWNEDCPEGDCKPFEQEFSIFGTDETAHAGIEFLNHCECQGDSSPPSYIKCQNGNYHCGECDCDEGFEGALCECEEQDITEDLAVCAAPTTDDYFQLELCSGKGTCECGKCACNMEDTGFRIDGEFCGCDTSMCPHTGGMECSGHGKCDCKSYSCACDDGWQGEDCSCSQDTSSCIVDGKKICAGNGECVCGECRCKQTNLGYFDPNDNCQTYIDICETIQECTLCLHAAKKQNSLDDGSDFVVKEECGVKCPDDFEDLQMRKDGLYILKNAKEHFTEEEKLHAGMMSCSFETIIDGESCTLDAFMERKVKKDQKESNIIIGAEKCKLFPINLWTIMIMSFLGFLLLGLLILLIAWFGIMYYQRKEYLDHKKGLEMNQFKPNPLYTEPVTEHSAALH